ncbi:M48 family metallopeptidase [Lichenicoccus roseus]|uniref:M48 family metallopeptidase n=2 Tax=Lichenicoccus roseus TaxID=2683649 RepID=A0A5R9J2P7_9PROT|nr:M48 family metallopeptidase [Lichenicoccus roseus]TLU71910.1 M48 family metallopeptidase [Lichenicoccus roseus]
MAPPPEMLLLAGGETPIRWQRSRQARRVSLRIDPRAGTVVVTLPPRITREAGLALLHAHSGWISGKLAALPGHVVFDAEAMVSLSGVPHVIRHHPQARRGVWVEAGEIRVSGDHAFLQRRVLDFLRGEARDVLGALARGIAEASVATGAALRPRRLAIKDTSSRWGSCSSDGVVMFSWRLVMAPPEIQHYVVAHELAHLRHLDHGANFWALVAALTPHRQRAEAWLRLHGAALLRMG